MGQPPLSEQQQQQHSFRTGLLVAGSPGAVGSQRSVILTSIGWSSIAAMSTRRASILKHYIGFWTGQAERFREARRNVP
jgi:hypothetical protein